ncbi:MAG TPA: helix-turn-helix domain-containing protein [Candidatus Binataceae bacterium]|nr:helix-turn-helix domain-containing protein [Candidatus Binataceae bacterium]
MKPDPANIATTIFLTVPEAAQHLRCSVSEIYALIKARELAAAKIGGLLRIPRAGLERIAERACVEAMRKMDGS